MTAEAWDPEHRGDDPALWHQTRSEVRGRLIEVARRRGLITYGELCIGLAKPKLFPGSADLSGLLFQVSRYERRNGRPLLTALVVNADGRPGRGFFSMAQSEGMGDGSDDLALWAGEVRA